MQMQPLTSPALTEDESAAVNAHRLAHGALREAAAAVDIAYQYISRKAQPCEGIVSEKCAALKKKLRALHSKVAEQEKHLETARQSFNTLNLLTARLDAATIRDALLLLQREITDLR